MKELLSTIWCFFGDNTAEIIALSALLFTAYQAYVTRKHNKLSVKPHLSESTDKTQKTGEAIFKYFVSNNGLGPAVISKWKLLLNSVELNNKEHTTVENVLKNTLSNRNFGFSISTWGNDYVLPCNETKQVLLIHCEIKDDNDFKSVEKSLNKLELIIEYKSMYGKTYHLDTRNKQ